MKYAVMSDVHANPEALKTALEDARRRRCEKFVLLGDVTGYGYDVVETERIARDSFDVVLMGNHDSACVGLEPWMDVHTNRNYFLDLRQHDQLPDGELSWLRGLPYVHSTKDAAFVHGDFTSPQSWRYLFAPQVVAANLVMRVEQILFCGHTHHAAAWEYLPRAKTLRIRHAFERGTRLEMAVSKGFKVKDGCRYVVNVGSVGYPRFDTCSSYVIYDDVSRRITFRHLPFDLRAYAERMAAHGIPIPLWLEDAMAAPDAPGPRP